MHLASIGIVGITFEISKEMRKHSLFRNMHTIATIVRLHKYCTYMHLASIDIEGITFEISKEMEKHNLFRNMHTIYIATSPECLMLSTQK